jgi:hypothetical protein
VRLLLENLNREPEHAEIRYLAHNLDECREYFGRIQSPALGWAFTVNHAHLVPEGIDGFLDAMDARPLRRGARGRQPRQLGRAPAARPRARSTSRACSSAWKAAGYRGHYMMAFGSLDDMLAGRDWLVRAAG